MIIKNAVVLTPEKDETLRFIEISNGKINNLGSMDAGPLTTEEIIDAQGGYVAPGLIDTHTHGGFGVDFGDLSHEDFATLLDALPKFGTTAVLGAMVSTSIENLAHSLMQAKVYLQSADYSATQFLGFHVEGPFINPDQRGAQELAYIRTPDLKLMHEIVDLADGLIKVFTLAPEMPNAMDLIRYLVDEGIVVSIGHSAADPETVFKAIELGATMATHLYNGMSPLHHRKIGVVGAVLFDKTISAEINLDGHHVNPIAAKLAYDLKGPDHLILMTDAMSVVGLPEGKYERSGEGNDLIYADGVVRLLSNGQIAGSALTMDQAFRNAMEFLDVDPFVAAKLASTNAARAINSEHLGAIEVGRQADLVIFDKDFKVERTFIRGKQVYKG